MFRALIKRKSAARACAGLAACALMLGSPTNAESPVAHSFRGMTKPLSAQPRIASTAPKDASPPLPGCPTDSAAWASWRDRAIEQLLQPRLMMEQQPGPFLDPSQVATQSLAIANFLEDCGPDQAARPIVGRLAEFTSTQSMGLDVYRQFSHGLDDLDYVDHVKDIAQLPCLLRSPAFLQRISDPSTYGQAAAMVQAQNAGQTIGQCPPDGTQWTSLFYKSAYLGTPDDADAFGRFLVLIPGLPHDRWIQFGIWAPDEVPSRGRSQSEAKINNVSIVAVAKNRVAGDQRYNVVLDWWRSYDDAAISLRTRREATGVTGNCQQCHKTAVIGIHPEAIYRPDPSTGKLLPAPELQPVVDGLNKLARSKAYRFPTQAIQDLQGSDAAAEPVRYGPAMGPDEDDRQTAKAGLMQACTARHQLSPESVKQVSKSMNCAQCHHERPTGWGAINFPMATQKTKSRALKDGHWPNLVYHFIQRGLMPPPETRAGEPPLTDAEKEALFDCLSLEYHDIKTNQGLFVDWLKGGTPKARERSAESVAMLARAMAQTRPAPVSESERQVQSRDGASDFANKCARCHSLTPGEHITGPSLHGVFNRLAGTVPDFDYSPSYVTAGKLGVRWDELNLKAYLIDQPAFLSQKIGAPASSEMDKHYPDEAFRYRIVEFLREQAK